MACVLDWICGIKDVTCIGGQSPPYETVHKGKPIKKGLLLAQLKIAGLTAEEFLRLYR